MRGEKKSNAFCVKGISETTGDETDTEVAHIEFGTMDTGDHYSIQSCRGGAAYLVQPEDVMRLSLDCFNSHFARAGWTRTSQSPVRYTFTHGNIKYGNVELPPVALYASGKLMVRTSNKRKAREIAECYDRWLIEDGEEPKDSEPASNGIVSEQVPQAASEIVTCDNEKKACEEVKNSPQAVSEVVTNEANNDAKVDKENLSGE